MAKGHSDTAAVDPCGTWTKTQWYALIWFCGAIVVGGLLTKQLSQIDRWMYDHNGDRMDYSQYRSNREASASLGSERVDSRSLGGYADAVETLRKESRAGNWTGN